MSERRRPREREQVGPAGRWENVTGHRSHIDKDYPFAAVYEDKETGREVTLLAKSSAVYRSLPEYAESMAALSRRPGVREATAAELAAEKEKRQRGMQPKKRGFWAKLFRRK